MTDHKRMNIHLKTLTLTLVLSVALLNGCGSSSSIGGPGGGGREFVSGNLTPGAIFTHVFMSAKSVPYFCRFHGGAGGVGMSGVITVGAAGTANKFQLSITTATDLPDLAIEAGDTVTWTNNDALTHTVESDN